MKKSLYLTSSGTLSRDQNTLLLELESGEKRYFPIEQIGDIHCFGETNLNKRLLEYLTQQGVPVHFYNYYEYYVGSYYPREHHHSGYLTLKQAEHYLDEEKRINLARRFVKGALQNLQQVLRYYANRGKPLQPIVEAIAEVQQQVEAAASVEMLMQLEGQAREAYYSAFDLILENPDFAFEGRSRRPPANRLNALLSFGNSLMYTLALSEIYRTHLDPRIGFLHATNYRRFSLNLDVAEVFKPVLVDRTVLTLISLKQIQPEHFGEELGGVYLNDEGRKRFLQAWEERLQGTFQHRRLKRNISYRTALRLELYKIEKHLMGEKPYEPFRVYW
ncbi:MAG: type I-B CRISPR-associated endonuclease Cas1b [Armatimonadota bacterium]|nr:type I-B CRISPR-associated endonuclease Cas1b [Armatimonadota bacterium]